MPSVAEGRVGRELDALVAEKVMEFKWYSSCGKSFLIPPFAQPRFDAFHAHWRPGKEFEAGDILLCYASDYQNCAIPEFSTKIAAAWSVVEKMREKGLLFSCGSPFWRGEKVAEWYVRFGNTSVEPTPGATMPEAVCRAALRAAAGEEGKGMSYDAEAEARRLLNTGGNHIHHDIEAALRKAYEAGRASAIGTPIPAPPFRIVPDAQEAPDER